MNMLVWLYLAEAVTLNVETLHLYFPAFIHGGSHQKYQYESLRVADHTA